MKIPMQVVSVLTVTGELWQAGYRGEVRHVVPQESVEMLLDGSGKVTPDTLISYVKFNWNQYFGDLASFESIRASIEVPDSHGDYRTVEAVWPSTEITDGCPC